MAHYKGAPRVIIGNCHCGMFQRPLRDCPTGKCKPMIVKPAVVERSFDSAGHGLDVFDDGNSRTPRRGGE